MVTVYTPSVLKAADISVGATTWYTKWETPDSWGFDFDDPAILYGPVFSVKFTEDYSFTFVFLYGQFNEKTSMDIGTLIPMEVKIDRYDSDAALNYKLNSYLKLFAGVKYMGYKYKATIDDGTVSDSFKADHAGYGPGGGLSAVFPIWDDFYFLANISGIYLWGSQDNGETSDDYIEYGINTGASIAYYISGASTTISLGGRYQAYTTEYDDSTSPKDKNKFYGATLTATYSFSI
jgi:hypothetical protein